LPPGVLGLKQVSSASIEEAIPLIFVGDDWAEDHHDIHLMDADGARLASRRLPEGLAGIRGFHELVAAHAEEPGQVVIGIETDRGLWVEALGAAGYQVFAVNPLAVARYRDRHQVSGAKSDAGDAKLLADLVRTDRHNHARSPGTARPSRRSRCSPGDTRT
jgi:transposase